MVANTIKGQPKVKMIRLNPEQLVDLTEEDEQRILWTQQTGAEIDRDQQRFLEEAKAEQAAANERVRSTLERLTTKFIKN